MEEESHIVEVHHCIPAFSHDVPLNQLQEMTIFLLQLGPWNTSTPLCILILLLEEMIAIMNTKTMELKPMFPI